MITQIQFQKDASVLSALGEQVGTLERVVVNPSTKVVTDIVVRTGGLLKRTEKVVSVALIAETTENQILLTDEAGDLESLPPFEEEHLVDPPDATDLSGTPVTQGSIVVGYPVLGAPVIHGTVGNRPMVTQVDQNIPEGTVALKEGAKVIASGGEQVGKVERVVADPEVEQVTHLFIASGLFSKDIKLIPINWVTAIGEDKVHLRVKKDFVEGLANAPIAG